MELMNGAKDSGHAIKNLFAEKESKPETISPAEMKEFDRILDLCAKIANKVKSYTNLYTLLL